MKLLAPDLHINNIMELTLSYLKSHGIIALFIDIDNTIIDPSNWQVIKGFKEWLDEMTVTENESNNEKYKIRICFLSNTFSEPKRDYIKREFGKEVVIKAYKPLPKGFKYAIDRFGLKGKEGNIAIVGDHTLTDILGGNLQGLHTIKVRSVIPNRGNNSALRMLYSCKEMIYCLQNNIPVMEQEGPVKIYTQVTN